MLISCWATAAQDLPRPYFAIPPDLHQDANSITQLEDIAIDIRNINKMLVSKKKIVTILNKSGYRHIGAIAHYDNSRKIKKIEAKVYDEHGMEIEHFKQNDFSDLSAVEGGTLFSDSRKLALRYFPENFPVTVVFEVVSDLDNTAFIEPFLPYKDYYNSVVESKYSIKIRRGATLHTKLMNIDERFEHELNDDSFTITASNLKAIVPESHSPSLIEFVPQVITALDVFSYEGEKGDASSWRNFGNWMEDALFDDINDIDSETKAEIKQLVAPYTTHREKAKVLYQYMQSKTRYISVQVGIGGWKPMRASEVDELGYGDCKALTNYTKSLFEVAGIPAYYTILHSSPIKRDISSDIVSMQGNHAILAVPDGEDMIWLECTSQDTPFGFIGKNASDRDVLIVTPEGGKIVHTKKYTTQENELLTTGLVRLNEEGAIKAEVALISRGVQYGQRSGIDKQTSEIQDEYYKSYWDYIDNITIDKMAFEENKEEVFFKETIAFKALDYARKAGEEIILPLNVLNRSTYAPDRYKNRQRQLKLSLGFMDKDEVEIILPESMSIQFLPERAQVETPYGKYTSEVEKVSDHKLIYRRTFSIEPGTYGPEAYKEYRSFRKKVKRFDDQKIILTQ